MGRRRGTEPAHLLGLSVLGAVFVMVGWPAARAYGQVVQDCQPGQYVDRTAPDADRELNWTFSVASDAERCMQVAVGQSVFWNGDVQPDGTHPLGASGGDNPNPIGLHQNGLVTFTTVGTFGFQCLSHSSMKGAIKVVAAVAAPPVPALSPRLAVTLASLLVASGWFLVRAFRRRGPAFRASSSSG